ncbi:OmpP1/FadL family transporter [Sulfurimonas sp.]|uniref:OmpP1/FadL family transporter n=1 Tax=Sulfurimonas sp. TaxID=2022749 RepID=UPI0039E21744
MNKTIKLAVVAALALGATSAFATNGSTMIGMGAKTRGMAGIGIGMGHGAESTLSNPAFIANIKNGTEISFGGTLFMPDVENANTVMTQNGAYTGPTASSDADTFVIPSVSIAHKVNDNFYVGIGMWGTGGLGVDYRDASAAAGSTQMEMVTSLQLMQFGVPLVYKANNFSLGLTPIIQYGTLDINYFADTNQNGTSTTHGAGIGSDISLGYNIGLAYETGGITLGAVYKSKIDMDYDGQLEAAVGDMNGGQYSNNTLSTPAEYGVGISYSASGHTIALDYKNIDWEGAEGYKDFGWESQDVIIIGYQYATDDWAVRIGYSDTDSAVQDNAGKGLPLDSTIPVPPGGLTNTFNALGFPGNIETHYALGGTYNLSKTVSMDLAYVYAPEVTTSINNFMGQNITTNHSETSYSFQVNLAF